MLSTLTRINIYQYGWAFEIFLVAGFLSMIMWSVETHWMLVPVLILFGNALLLAYSSISGRWGDWVFLWMLEPLIIAVAIGLPISLGQRNRAQLRLIGRASGMLFSLLSLLLASFTCLLSMVAGLLR
jgi:hypothetical protein